ncbi:MAG: alanine racemase C-terminal domain-containing protein, partial [Pirellulaceae bacterium]|jgi:alanine racemase|nr:alanine racemase C-terminal domain-containing protein [Pirellulaceae bacterium]
LGPKYRGDICRPGIALYGGNPFATQPNPFQSVAYLEGTVLQLRPVGAGKPVGYGATGAADSDRLLAVVGIGYADGVSRLLSGRGFTAFKGRRLPIVGRISMDLTHVDVTSVAKQIELGDWVEFIGTTISVDEVARWAQTISYEVLTGLGPRLERHYFTSMT